MKSEILKWLYILCAVKYMETCICDTEPVALCPVHGVAYKEMQPEDILHGED